MLKVTDRFAGAQCPARQELALHRCRTRHKRRLSQTLSCLFAIIACFVGNQTTVQASPPMGVNGNFDWVDVMKGTGPAGPAGPATSVGQDANGWPTNDCYYVPFDARHNMPWDGPDPNAVNPDISGTYKLSFKGKATITGGSEDPNAVLIQNQTYSPGTNTTSADVVVLPNHLLVILTFTNTQRTASSNSNTGLTNIRLIRPGYPANATQVFTTASLNAYGPAFSAIRMLGPDAANDYQNFSGNSLIPVQWADRVKVADAYQSGTPLENNNASPGHQAHGVAWEYMILLCNQTHHDMWLNLPAGATDDYVAKLATLLKNGNSFTPGLAPDLHIYVEYSNEVWNFGFPQYVYNAVSASNEVAAGHSPLNSDGSTDGQTWAARRYGKRLYEISKVFGQVYGKSAINTIIRPVFLWQYDAIYAAGTFGPGTASVLAWMNSTYGPLKNYLYGIGEAPYYGPGDISNLNNIFNTMWTGSDQTRSRFINWQNLAAFYGVKQVGYESGPSLSAGVYGGDATRDARMTSSEVHHFLDNWFAVGGDEVNFFALQGSVSPFGDWLLVENFDHLVTNKMNGALQILNASMPRLTAGFVLPYTVGEIGRIDASQYAQTGDAPGTPQNLTPTSTTFIYDAPGYDYLLRTDDPGTYSIALHGSQDSADINAYLYVDNQMLGTVQLPTSVGDSAPVSVTLGPGQHTLRVIYKYTINGASDHVHSQAIDFTLTAGGGEGIVPSAPLNPRVISIGSGAIGLAWASEPTATEPTAISYTIYRSLSSGGPYSQIGVAATNHFNDSGLTNGKPYYYVVTAHNAVGESAYAPQVAAIATNNAAPAPPTGLYAPLARNGIVQIAWTGNTDAVYYNIYRSTTRVGGYNQVGSQMATTFQDGGGGPFVGGGPSDGTTYYYQVTAVNTFGSSAPSAPFAVKPVDVIPHAPPAPTALPSNGRVALKWTPPPGMSPAFFPPQYSLYRSTTSGSGYTRVFQTAVDNAVDVGLTNGVTYYYVITAANGVGESAYSPEVQATPAGSGVISIDAGGAATGGFVADSGFAGGLPLTTASPIDTSLSTQSAPQTVYQSCRTGSGTGTFTYTLGGLLPNGTYTVRLHFAEISSSVTGPGQRVFNVLANGGQILTNLDVFQRTGSANRALVETIPVTANSSSKLVLTFVHSSVGAPMVSGIELF